MASESITQLLSDWGSGSEEALESLAPQVYDELHRIAVSVFRSESSGHTLQPTALVNEAFQHLIDVDVSWSDRQHFFALSARMMRRILVSHSRKRRAQKRGGDDIKVTLQDVAAPSMGAGQNALDVLDLDDAILELEQFDERKAKMIELHYFGGLTYKELAAVMDLSESTVHEDLRTAKAWLKNYLL